MLSTSALEPCLRSFTATLAVYVAKALASVLVIDPLTEAACARDHRLRPRHLAEPELVLPT